MGRSFFTARLWFGDLINAFGKSINRVGPRWTITIQFYFDQSNIFLLVQTKIDRRALDGLEHRKKHPFFVRHKKKNKLSVRQYDKSSSALSSTRTTRRKSHRKKRKLSIELGEKYRHQHHQSWRTLVRPKSIKRRTKYAETTSRQILSSRTLVLFNFKMKFQTKITN